MQELSTRLFKDVMQMVVWKVKQQMKQQVQRGLLPLFSV